MKKKGFTLIELLAVIVILAIIALIATPIILNIIEDSKEQSIISSANLYIDGLVKQIATKNLTREFNPSSCTVANGSVTCDGQSLDYTVDGDKPTSGTITFNNGMVTGYTLDISGYTVTKSGSTVTIAKITPIVFNGTYVAGGQNDTYIGIAYLDPTDLSRTCTAQLAAQNLNDKETPTPTEIKSGCMKFYVFKDDGANYSMILDHNTSLYAGGNFNPLLAEELTNDTEGWAGNPRLITADEIAHIVGADVALNWDATNTSHAIYLDGGRNNTTDEYCVVASPNSFTCSDGWQKKYASSETPSNYAWLYNYTSGCISNGCTVEDTNAYGEYSLVVDSYFTDTVSSEQLYTSYWIVTAEGYLFVGDYNGGIRPVITLPKSIFE